MSYCIKCGRKLVDRYLENEGVIPYCENCKEYRFRMYNVAISMIVIAPNNKILLIKQYHKNDYILVAGYVNYSESIESALKRELKEETGYSCANIELLITIRTTVAFCNEKIDIYLATGLTEGEQQLDDDEYVDVRAYELSELEEYIYSGKIQDSKTIAAILAYKNKFFCTKNTD